VQLQARTHGTYGPILSAQAARSKLADANCVCVADPYNTATLNSLQVDTMAFQADEQDKFLKEASNSVKKNAYFMRKAMVSF